MFDRAALARSAWLLALVLCAPGSAEEPGEPEQLPFRVSGTVTNPAGEPVENAEVLLRVADQAPGNRHRHDDWLDPPTTTTDESGRFEFRLAAEGPYRLVAIHGEHPPRFHPDDVSDGQAVDLAFELGLEAAGVVSDTDGRPVGEAEVRACTNDGPKFGARACLEARTDGEGRFSFDRLSPGRQHFQALAPGKALSRIEIVKFPPDENDEAAGTVELTLEPGGEASGTVTDDAGTPLAGVPVVHATERALLRQAVMARDVVPLLATVTNDAGEFSLAGLPAGAPLKLLARTSQLRPTESATLTLEPGGVLAGVSIVYERRSSATVRLVDRDEQPVARLDVLWKPVKEGEETRSGGFRLAGYPGLGKVEALGEGRFEISEVKPDRYDITLLPGGYEEIVLEGVRLSPGGVTELGTHVVRSGVTLSGFVVDDLGAPIDGASVEGMFLKDNAGLSRSTKSDADGRFSLGGLTEAPLVQFVVKADGHATKQERGVHPDQGDLEIVLERTGSVTGQAVLEDGSVANRLEASLEPSVGGARAFRRSSPLRALGDEDGRFEIESAAPGTYSLLLNAKGARPTRVKDVVVDPGEPTDVGTRTLEPGRTLSGVVLDLRDGSPVAGAGIRVSTTGGSLVGKDTVLDTAMTDVDGRFAVDGLGDGSIEVRAEHRDYAPDRRRITLAEDQPAEDLTLRLGQGGLLRGTVLDDDEQPSPDRSIGVIEAGGSFAPDTTVRTNGAGEYRLERLRPGTYRVMLIPDTSAGVLDLQRKSANIREGEETVVNFGGEPKITFEGLITRGGRPVGDVTVMLVPGDSMDMMQMQSATADMNGRFEVRLKHAGAYNVIVADTAQGLGSVSGQSRIVVPDEPSVSMEIALDEGGISGRVTDKAGEPIRQSSVGAMLEGAAPGTLGSGGGALAGADGFYRMEGVGAGTYNVSARAEGYESATRTVIVDGSGEVADVNFQLERAGQLRGRVVDIHGNGIAGAIVFARAAGAPGDLGGDATESDAEGYFLTSAPSSGPCDIEAVARGYAPGTAHGFVPSTDADGPGAVVTLTQGGRIVIRVLDAAGNPLDGAQPSLKPDDPSQTLMVALIFEPVPATGADGTSTATHLPDGGYTVWLPEHPEAVPQAASLSGGGEAVVTLRLP